ATRASPDNVRAAIDGGENHEMPFHGGIAAVAFAFITLFTTGCTTMQTTDNVKLVTEEFMVPAVDPGIELYVRNKRPEGMAQFTKDNIVLFVHGATYPAETSFDLKLDGISWMEYIASRGYDVYLVDMRGFSRSTRPPEMDQPAASNPPIVRTGVAAKDIGAVVDFI